jgi:type II secretory pathway pseudopilin PulG
LLIVIVVLAVFAGAIIPRLQPSIVSQLTAAGDIVATDLGRARDWAVANNSSYRVTFDVAGNLYYLQHSGTNSQLDTLPPSPFANPTDPATRYTQPLASLPLSGPDVCLAKITRGSPPQPATDVEFGPFGETTASAPTVVWLKCGSGTEQRYLSLTVQPVTGLVSTGLIQATAP